MTCSGRSLRAVTLHAAGWPIDLGLEGKRALVTGAGVGIGRGIACWLARAGCDVVLADKDPATLADAVAEVAAEGTRVGRRWTADLRDPTPSAASSTATVAELGGLDVAVNNVGSLAGRSPGVVRRSRRRRAARHRGAEPVRHHVVVPRRGAGDGRGGDRGRDRERQLGGDDPAVGAHGALRRGQGRRSTTSPRPSRSSSRRTASACVAVAPGTTLTPVVAAALSDEQVEQLVAGAPARSPGRTRRPRAPRRRARVRPRPQRHRPARLRRQRRPARPQPSRGSDRPGATPLDLARVLP